MVDIKEIETAMDLMKPVLVKMKKFLKNENKISNLLSYINKEEYGYLCIGRIILERYLFNQERTYDNYEVMGTIVDQSRAAIILIDDVELLINFAQKFIKIYKTK